MAQGPEVTFGRPRWTRWLVNRFVLTGLVIAVVAGGWDFYASTHDDGIVAGRVVDGQGRPVAGATVTLWIFNFTTFREDRHVQSGPDGAFLITGNPSHNIEVSAAKPGLGASKRVPIRLYFRSQDTVLAAPLVLEPQS
jgi:hypothetical protein